MLVSRVNAKKFCTDTLFLIALIILVCNSALHAMDKIWHHVDSSEDAQKEEKYKEELIKRCRKALQDHRTKKSKIPDDQRLLHNCIRSVSGQEEFDLFGRLVFHGASLTEKTHADMTPLHVAALHDKADHVQLILDYLESQKVSMLPYLTAQDSDKRTPLHCAAEFKNPAVAAKLIAYGTPVNILGQRKKNYGRMTPLGSAVFFDPGCLKSEMNTLVTLLCDWNARVTLAMILRARKRLKDSLVSCIGTCDEHTKTYQKTIALLESAYKKQQVKRYMGVYADDKNKQLYLSVLPKEVYALAVSRLIEYTLTI